MEALFTIENLIALVTLAGLEIVLGAPHGVRCIKRMIFEGRALEKVKFLEPLHAIEIRVAAVPDLLERLFRALLHVKAIHCDEHGFTHRLEMLTLCQG